VTRQSYVSPRVSRRRPPTTHHAHPAPPPTHNSKAASQGNVVSKTYPTPPREKSVIRVRSKGAASQPQHPATGESHWNWSNPLPPAFASVSVPRTPAKPCQLGCARQPAAGRPCVAACWLCLPPPCLWVLVQQQATHKRRLHPAHPARQACSPVPVRWLRTGLSILAASCAPCGSL
jgi:hypothetical protein